MAIRTVDNKIEQTCIAITTRFLSLSMVVLLLREYLGQGGRSMSRAGQAGDLSNTHPDY